MVLHQEEAGIENLGAHAFTEDPTCVSGWQLSSPRPSHAYGPEFAWQNGSVTKFASRERPQVVLNEGGWPTHLSNGVITSGWSGLSFTVVAPINTSAARHPSEMDAPHAPTVGTAAGSQGDTERHREAQRETERDREAQSVTPVVAVPGMTCSNADVAYLLRTHSLAGALIRTMRFQLFRKEHLDPPRNSRESQ